jgi:hypothetical protein
VVRWLAGSAEYACLALQYGIRQGVSKQMEHACTHECTNVGWSGGWQAVQNTRALPCTMDTVGGFHAVNTYACMQVVRIVNVDDSLGDPSY